MVCCSRFNTYHNRNSFGTFRLSITCTWRSQSLLYNLVDMVRKLCCRFHRKLDEFRIGLRLRLRWSLWNWRLSSRSSSSGPRSLSFLRCLSCVLIRHWHSSWSRRKRADCSQQRWSLLHHQLRLGFPWLHLPRSDYHKRLMFPFEGWWLLLLRILLLLL